MIKLLFGILGLAAVSGHTTSLCTGMAKSNPNMITVLIGTYHGTTRTPGTIWLGNIADSIGSGPFGPGCKVGIGWNTNVANSESTCKSKCGSMRTGSGRLFIPSDFQMNCYRQDTGAKSPSSNVIMLGPVPRTALYTCFRTLNVVVNFLVAIENQKAGIYSFKWTGVNYDLMQGGSMTPCTTIESKQHYISIDVSDGGEKCQGAPNPVSGATDMSKCAG
eukprot:CAMPEP_0175103878 /NCGR_PEP_ID=MMETSP0086_2-20121207/9373_1 /TAXON_ID=136419 /ORGANISM="Unknown Unknown, Strain D1" /LENGTH=218 /DNA_ID=CAMNT_0016379121 /DNA_START=74 /DNA_END=726 /DNA_ORIENTATION=+